MTSRAHQKDTDADLQLYNCLNSTPPRSFLMVAGAGSGKTTSLIKGISAVIGTHGDRLRLRRQKIACITFTEVAAGEIWADVGNNPLVHVSTIHSFLWSLVRSFQSDIEVWVANRIREKLTELNQAAAGFGSRVQKRTRDKNRSDQARYEQLQLRIGVRRSFTYGMGSDYGNGILGHDDIIKMVPQFIVEQPLMRCLIAQQYPVVFVDESQDTTENVVLALKEIDKEFGEKFCVGFFGDPMQRIYMTGIGEIPSEPRWATITKPENFRCPANVLRVANAIRRDGDGLVQTSGRTISSLDTEVSLGGTAHLFILPIDERRDQRIAQVRKWISLKNNDPQWQPNGADEGVKVLVIVHRMAAKRLGFGDLYAALNDKAPEKFKNGFLDGTTWPVYPFMRFVLPLLNAFKNDNEFEAMKVLRDQSPLLNRTKLAGVNVAARLTELRLFTTTLLQMMQPASTSTNADVLRYIHNSKVIDLDPKLLSYLNLPVPVEIEQQQDAKEAAEEDDGEELTKEVAAMDAFLACPACQFWGYFSYVNRNSPFSTQQGIKGAEFERVLVILDDDEGAHVQFSYDKYLGVRPLSDRDHANRADGKETVVERTRRLFYVCCTRALRDLIVVLFTAEVEFARQRMIDLELFPEDAIHSADEIAVL